MLVDLSLEELWKYKPAQNMEKDFDDFWAETLEISRKESLNVDLVEIDHYVKEINTYKVYYDGFGGARITAGRQYLNMKKEGLNTLLKYMIYYRANNQID